MKPHHIHTVADYDAAITDERRAYYRELIAQWEENTRREYQQDAEADQRAFEADISDESPIDSSRQYVRSGTTRNAE